MLGLDSITFTVLAPEADIPALQNNAIDSVGLSSLDDLLRAQRTPGISIHRAPAATWSHFTFNGAPSSILADPKLRLAIMRGIDRPAIANVSQRGLVDNPTPLNNHIYVAGQEGYQNNSSVAPLNPVQAREDLDDLGWKLNGPIREKDGRPLTIRLVLFDALTTATRAKGNPPMTMGSSKWACVQHPMGFLASARSSAMGPSGCGCGVGRGGRKPEPEPEGIGTVKAF